MNQSLLFCTLIALVPIVAWIYFFYYQHPAKKTYVVLSFLAGMLSVIPIKLYERYWDITIFRLEHINLFERLADLTRIPTLDTFLAYVITSVVVAFGLYVFTAMMMFCLEVSSGDDTIETFEKKLTQVFESPLIFITTGIIFGVAAYFLNMNVDKAIWFFVMVGALEEFVKHLVTRFSDEMRINSVADAIEFSIMVALGFAFVENILYFLDILTHQYIAFKQLAIYIMLRSVISVTAHVCFSAILGYYYGIAHFASTIYQESAKEHQHPVIKWFHRLVHLKESTVFKEEKMIEGMFLAIVIHALFNSLLEFNKMNLIVILLCGLFFTILNLLHCMDEYQREGMVTH